MPTECIVYGMHTPSTLLRILTKEQRHHKNICTNFWLEPPSTLTSPLTCTLCIPLMCSLSILYVTK